MVDSVPRPPIAISPPSPRRVRSRGGQAGLARARRIHPGTIDAIVDAMAAAATPQAEALAQLAVDETGYGVVADKIQKNLLRRRRSTSSSGR